MSAPTWTAGRADALTGIPTISETEQNRGLFLAPGKVIWGLSCGAPEGGAQGRLGLDVGNTIPA